AAGDRGREADAVVGAVDVVVHRLRDGDGGHPLLVHPQTVGEGVVATDRDEHVDPRVLDHLEGMGGEVVRTVPAGRAGEEDGDLGGLDARGVAAREVQEGPAGAVDGAHRVGVELDQVGGHRLRVVQVRGEQAAPAPADAGDLVPLLGDPVDHGLDARVQSGDVTAAGEYADPHGPLPPRLGCPAWVSRGTHAPG